MLPRRIARHTQTSLSLLHRKAHALRRVLFPLLEFSGKFEVPAPLRPPVTQRKTSS